MMAFKLEVLFHGLCAFVPTKKKTKKKTIKKTMYVFLPDARPLAGEPLTLSPHRAVVKYIQNDAAGVEVAPGNAEGIWRLAHVHLTFRPGGQPVQRDDLRVDLKGGASSVPFRHVVSLAAACRARRLPNPGVLDPKLVERKLGDRAGDIAARILLQSGRVTATSLSSTGGDQAIEWTFRPFFARLESGDHEQVAAARVLFEMDVAADFVDLHATYLGNESPAGILRLRPRPNVGRVRIDVLNEEAEQILRTSQPPSVLLGRPRPEDTVFEAYSALLKTPVPRGGMPIPVAARLAGSQGPVAGGSPPCSPVRLQAVRLQGI